MWVVFEHWNIRAGEGWMQPCFLADKISFHMGSSTDGEKGASFEWVCYHQGAHCHPSLMLFSPLFFFLKMSPVLWRTNHLFLHLLWQILTTMIIMKWPQNTYNYSETSCVFVRSTLRKLQSMLSGSIEALTDMSIYNVRNTFIWFFFFLSWYCSVISRSRLARALFKCNSSWGKKLNQRMM